jgi:Protein of unknown function (DUF3048) N-terminal domain/Protein of unknown function (DUF3048) C-terminal domain
MPLHFSRDNAPHYLVFVLLLSMLVACSSPSPTPPPTAVRIVVTATPVPTATAAPTATLTPSPTDTSVPTSTPTPTMTETTAASHPPPVVPKGSVVDNDLWFMSQLINYFSQIGPHPPEPAIAREADVDPLTGLKVPDPALLQRRVVLARIMNDPSARPQTGLNEADLVFEELIDQRNGIAALTRLTGVYLGVPDATIRPLRSARLVNPSLADMFDGALVHSGASNGMRFLLSKVPVTNIDELFDPRAFCAIGDPRKTLTWVTTTVSHMYDYLKSKGLEKPVPLRGFEFSADPASGAQASSIGFDHLPFPVKTVGTVLWKYDAASGNYLRFANGSPHNTLQYQVTGTWGGACQEATQPIISQVHAANVVVINAPHHPTDPHDFTEDTNNFTNIFIELTGSGPAVVFRDGMQISGTWRRPTLQHFFQFLDANGNPIPLKPGNTWFEIVPPSYAPTVH